jgi:very-short-patch-repair endonuclease
MALCGIDVGMHGQRHTESEAGGVCGAVRGNERLERAIGALARRQHGVVTRTQLIGLGLGTGAIDWRLRTGRLRALQRGVYFVGPVAPQLAGEMAAVLSCGRGAVLSPRIATSLWRLLPPPTPPGDIEVTVMGRDPGRRPGVRVHRVRRLEPDEVTTFQGIPITTPARTALDLAAIVSARELEQAVAEVQRRGLADPRRLGVLVGRYPTRRGAGLLRRLTRPNERPAITRSQAEERFLALIRDAELPSPEANVMLHGFEVDFLWREERLVVEIDGYAFHADRQAFERDRRRDAELAAHGYRVIRVTWRQLLDAPTVVVARVAQVLARAH